MSDQNYDWRLDVLRQRPVWVDENTTPESLQAEMSERLEALLALHNGLEPTAEGWRDLALALARKHERAFQIETPADRTGPSNIPGPKVGFWTFIRRSKGKKLMRKYESEGHPNSKLRSLAASAMARQNDRERRNSDPNWHLPAALTKRNAYELLGSKEAHIKRYQQPDILRRAPFEQVIATAMKLAALKLSQK